MLTSRTALSLACAAMLASCGGGGSNNTPTPTATGGGATPTPAPTSSACSLSSRQAWALNQLDEWYLFPDLLDRTVNPASYSTLQDYIDALVAPARAQSKDRYFTYITSIEEENAYYEEGATAGFGFRLGYDTPNDRVFVIEAFENAPALGMNIDRGSELIAIGTSEASLQLVSTIMATEGPYGVIDALGPSTAGTSRVLRVRDASGVERVVTLTKTEFALDPVSDRYGYKIIDDGGKKVGYVNLRTFIDTAENDLFEAFSAFRTAGVTEVVVDLRYNGGGLVSVAAYFGSLLARNNDGEVFARLAYRASKAGQNATYRFDTNSASIAPTKIAFITTGSSASASEMLINGLQPFLPDTNLAIIGSNTYGKPVGQIAIDRSQCDDRLRVLAFKVENADGLSEYYTGLADTVPNTCRAQDDISKQLGDPSEQMLATALDFLAGRSCTAITGTGDATATASATRDPARVDASRKTLIPRQPDTIERENPGSF